LTREALRLYLDKLARGGILEFHISNKSIDLVPVLAALAADLRLACRVRRDTEISPDEARLGKSASMWAVMATDESDLEPLATDSPSNSPRIPAGEAVWTDDFSSVVGHLILVPR
jgi:hypothetical protein